jgi:hypothetical protein
MEELSPMLENWMHEELYCMHDGAVAHFTSNMSSFLYFHYLQQWPQQNGQWCL